MKKLWRKNQSAVVWFFPPGKHRRRKKRREEEKKKKRRNKKRNNIKKEYLTSKNKIPLHWENLVNYKCPKCFMELRKGNLSSVWFCYNGPCQFAISNKKIVKYNMSIYLGIAKQKRTQLKETKANKKRMAYKKENKLKWIKD